MHQQAGQPGSDPDRSGRAHAPAPSVSAHHQAQGGAGSGRSRWVSSCELARWVPLIQAGYRAGLALPHAPESEQPRLRERVKAGSAALEELVRRCLPSIERLARLEHARRAQWRSTYGVEDLVQDGVIGLVKGLRRYRVGVASSTMSYLELWMRTEMRRAAERMDADVGVSVELSQRFRRIRALRGRLAADLGRDPSDAEVIDASGQQAYRVGYGAIQYPNKSGGGTVSVQDLRTERLTRERVLPAVRLEASGGTGEIVHRVSAQATAVPGADVEVTTDAVAQALRDLLQGFFEDLGVGRMQREVISRYFGLGRCALPQSQRQISRDLGIGRTQISRIVMACVEQLQRPGGPLHARLQALLPEELIDLGLDGIEYTLSHSAPDEPRWPITLLTRHMEVNPAHFNPQTSAPPTDDRSQYA